MYRLLPSESFRPTHIARKELPDLPVEQRNTKANYWHGMDRQPRPAYHETLYLDEHFTIGSLCDGHTSQRPGEDRPA